MTVEIKETVEQQQYLTFLLSGEECAISILKVREIIEYDTVTTVPKMPSWVRGVINLRGAVVPVVSLAAKFGMQEKLLSKTTCIVIVEALFEGQESIVGLIADAVNQVLEFLLRTSSPCRTLARGSKWTTCWAWRSWAGNSRCFWM